MPDVTGRRSGHEIIHRLRRKWDLSHSLSRYPRAGARPGSRACRVARAGRGGAGAPQPEVRRTCTALGRRAGRAGRAAWQARRRTKRAIKLDLGFSRGIGFYTQMIFELEVADALAARSKSAAAAATMAWPACWAAAATTAGPGSHSGWSGLPRSGRAAVSARPPLIESRSRRGISANEDRRDRHHPAGSPLQGQPLRRDHRAAEDGRIPGASSQRPPVRSDDRRPQPLPRRVHEAVRHRHPGAGRAAVSWA